MLGWCDRPGPRAGLLAQRNQLHLAFLLSNAVLMQPLLERQLGDAFAAPELNVAHEFAPSLVSAYLMIAQLSVEIQRRFVRLFYLEIDTSGT